MELLAPNGQKSNLTVEQWHLVRTPEFKSWFGDWEKLALTKLYDSGIDEVSLKRLEDSVSKVVDENGEPLVCYHGSKSKEKFTVFKHLKYWNVFWFTPNIETAKMYSERDRDSGLGEVFKCFLSIKNPSKTYPFDINKFDGFIDFKFDMDYFNWKQIKEIRTIQVVNSNQIKLADGTNTTFDGNNPDIRFEKGGIIPTYKEQYNQKFGYPTGTSHSIEEIAKDTGVSLKGLQLIYNKGIGAYKTNPKSVRPNVKSKEQWAMARVYSAVMGGKTALIDKKELKMENGGIIPPNYITVVNHFGNGVELNNLFNEWNNINNEQQWNQWAEKVINTKFGTYKNENLLSLMDRFNFNLSQKINSVQKKDFRQDVERALNLNQDVKFEKGGNVNSDSILLAPNGKPSNLTPAQYKLVRTLEFKEWFGDWENDPENSSKVVDENGEPLVVWHGTNKKFTEFRSGYHKDRYFFTNDKELSKSYGSINMEVFLNIRKPFKTNNNMEFTNMFDKGDVDNNYDGVFYDSATERGEPINAIICFSPNQIKLADSTNTTFDPKNPDIRFEVGGEINSHIKETKQNHLNNQKMETGGAILDLQEVAETIRFINGSGVDINSIWEDDKNYYFKYINSSTETSIPKKGVDNIIYMKRKKLVKYEDGGDIQEENEMLLTPTINSNQGKIKINLDKKWEHEGVVLAPVSLLIQCRLFDRKKDHKYSKEDSLQNIEGLKEMFLNDGITQPIVLDFIQSEGKLVMSEGNHRLNAIEDLQIQFYPVIVKKSTLPHNLTDKGFKTKIAAYYYRTGSDIPYIPLSSFDAPYQPLPKPTFKANAIDTLNFNVPLLIRLFEFIREEVTNDVQLHYLLENALKINKPELTMDDYEPIIKGVKELAGQPEKKAKGGLLEGKSHAEGGIPLVVKSTGQPIEVEGGELVVNKFSASETDKFEFEGKEMTPCEIVSELNSLDNNGVKIDCDKIIGKFEK